MASTMQRSRLSLSRSSVALRPLTPCAITRMGRSRPTAAATSADHVGNNIICAISEARGIFPTVGLSFINLSTSEAVLCQLSDTQTFARTCHKLAVFSPSEIVFASAATDSKLLSVIQDNLDTHLGDIRMTGIDRRYWSEVTGQEYVHSLAIPSDRESLTLSLANSYYAVCCFAAVMKYIDLGLGMTVLAQSLRIRSEPSEGAMMIDISTLACLEVAQNVIDSKSRDCLFGLLNHTRTRMGARFLKSNLLQPSTNEKKLLERYEAVSQLSTNDEMLLAVRQALSGFIDVDKLLASLVIVDQRLDFAHMEHSVNDVIMLKSFIDMILPLWQALTGTTSKELQEIRQLCVLDNYIEIQDMLRYTLNDDVRFSSKPAELRNQRVWALNAGVNGFLDVARQTYSEFTKDVTVLIEALQEQYSLRIELKYDAIRQYHITIKSTDLEARELPDIFINVVRKKRTVECQTMDLIKLNQKVKDAHNEVVVMSDQSIQELIRNVRGKLPPLFKISEAIALLDMLSTFAELGISNKYVQPELTSTLAIESGRHPIRESIQREPFVPNDVYATHQSRFQIITGCNMSGKSTYIRSIALMVIMAQIGCFVPAEYASFPIIHQLFARVSTDDSIEANASSFASEMRDVAFILHNVEPRSIVLVDELGRGTSTDDGLVTAIAICEALIESKAMVWFATHFRDLPRILSQRAGVVNLHLAVDVAPDLSVMKMKYKIADGVEEQTNYGLALARLVGLPAQIIDMATTITEELGQIGRSHQQQRQSLIKLRRQNLVLKLKEQLSQAAESNIDDHLLRCWLKRIQEEFTIRMNMVAGDVQVDEVVDDGHIRGGSEARSSSAYLLTAGESESVLESFSDELLLPLTPPSRTFSRHDGEIVSWDQRDGKSDLDAGQATPSSQS